VDSPGKPRLHFFWLILPWLTVGSLLLAETTGFRSWIFKNLPSKLSDIAQNNIGWGILLVTVGSSARWVYLRWYKQTQNPFFTWVSFSFWTVLLTLSHISVAAGILFAGCMIVMWGH